METGTLYAQKGVDTSLIQIIKTHHASTSDDTPYHVYVQVLPGLIYIVPDQSRYPQVNILVQGAWRRLLLPVGTGTIFYVLLSSCGRHTTAKAGGL